jgi:hypothetical protein
MLNIVDVRHGPGGTSVFASMLIHFLSEVESLIGVNEGSLITTSFAHTDRNRCNKIPTPLDEGLAPSMVPLAGKVFGHELFHRSALEPVSQ